MFKKILSTRNTESTINLGLFLIRLSLGILMAVHGYQKLVGFEQIEPKFINFMGLSAGISLWLTIFAELICSFFIIAGLFTRFALIPLIIAMLVATFMAHSGDIAGEGEHAFMYLIMYIVLFITGAGKWSADWYIFDKKNAENS